MSIIGTSITQITHPELIHYTIGNLNWGVVALCVEKPKNNGMENVFSVQQMYKLCSGFHIIVEFFSERYCMKMV